MLSQPCRKVTINQQNNAVNQQVNNSQEIENFQNQKKVANELIDEVTYGAQNLDIRTTVAAIPSDTASGAMEILNGAENATGEKH